MPIIYITMKKATQYILIAITIEVLLALLTHESVNFLISTNHFGFFFEILLIVIFIKRLISPLSEKGANTGILWIPIPVAAIISLVLGFLAGQYIHFEKMIPFFRFLIGVSIFYAIFVISVILGFGFFHLLYWEIPSGIWVFPSMFVFLVSPYIILIGCILGLILCSLKEDL